MEILTNMGWSPANTIEAILVSIRAQLIAGGARLDNSNKQDYSPQEAKEAFDRMMSSHGWW
jgi:ubiquitin-protein ligase